ncbi:MAG: prolipoprotein diacylglyceryl transferase [Clostridia bacterium]|nr:prolipoprotein diacylglyceryl transferase [Clostridia bacterium]
MSTISFPGLGIGEFSINSTAFTVFGIEIQWYALIILFGMILAIFYAYTRSKVEVICADDLLDITLFAVIFGIIGARAYYVLTTLSTGRYNSFFDVINIRGGGLAIYGAVIAGAASVYLTCRLKKIKWQKAFDMAAPACMIGQIVGRWGNFANGEAFGSIVTSDHPLYFLRMGLHSHVTESTFGTSQMYYVHPTFLYESVWNLIGFVIIHLLYKKKKFDGQVVLMYFTWYGFGRMFIEGLRTDSLYLFSSWLGETVRISQLIGFLCFVLGLAGLIVCFVLASKGKLEKPVISDFKFGKKSNAESDQK